MTPKITYLDGKKIRQLKHAPLAGWIGEYAKPADKNEPLELATVLQRERCQRDLIDQLAPMASVRNTLRKLLDLSDRDLLFAATMVDPNTQRYIECSGIVRFHKKRGTFGALPARFWRVSMYSPDDTREIIRHAIESLPSGIGRPSTKRQDESFAMILVEYWLRTKGKIPTVTRSSACGACSVQSDFMVFAIDMFSRIGRRSSNTCLEFTLYEPLRAAVRNIQLDKGGFLS